MHQSTDMLSKRQRLGVHVIVACHYSLLYTQTILGVRYIVGNTILYQTIPSNMRMGWTIGLFGLQSGTKTQIRTTKLQSEVQLFTYPFLIFDVHVSSFLNKAFHCVVTTFAGCNMQGSLLIGESNKFEGSICNARHCDFKLTDFHICQCRRLTLFK